VRGAFVLTTLSVAAAVVLAGCGETVDTAKQTFPRSTVPAGDITGNKTTATGEPKANDPAFSNDKLIKIDPCGLLTEDVLASVGEPGENKMEDYGNCSNYMKDKDGKDLYITFYIGETISGAEEADENIGGLPAFESELDDGSACFVNAVTSTNPNVGLRTQVGGDGEDLCEVATTVLTAGIEQIREDPPEREEANGSIAGLNPCSLLEPDELAPLVDNVETTLLPYTLHWCTWNGENISLSVWFRSGYDPDDTNGATPVDLGDGITAYQAVKASPTVSCRLRWRHRSTGKESANEIVEVGFEYSKKPSDGDNGCGVVTEVSKLLIPELPKP
jgi:hypothetical protein